jgi:large subunit ribosomal protein L3
MQNRRTGLIGIKLGMTQIFSQNGNSIPVTLVKIDKNKVIAQKEGKVTLVTGEKRKMKKPQKVIAEKAGLESFRFCKEFKVSSNNLLVTGTDLGPNHFRVGQLIDAQSITIGKGFAGVMKRYHFAGLEASHGVSASHRSGGSTGQRQDPGKVFKNKKMAGHMGAKKRTIQNLRVMDISDDLGIIAIHGALPGKKGQVIYLTDAIKR